MSGNHVVQEPIAIVGAACRFSGDVSSLGSLWEMASKAKSGHCKVPLERWDADKWHHPSPDRKGGIAVKHGYFLKEDVAAFDAPFFSVTAKEAAAMDPMKRQLLEVSYESIENAGIPFEALKDTISGCYVGCMTNDYEMSSLHDIYDQGHAAASATSEAMIANRVSHFFGMRGPSLTLDTACSSSLYALHLACQSLRTGETNLGLVAGVNLILIPNTMHQLSAMHMLSPEGISHTFDARANGYGRGEGIGSLIVKRLSDAVRDGDTIRAVVRATGVNADGKTASVTQPSADAQAMLIDRTYAAAGLPQEDTQFFECHGTGTPVGDPIELDAIARTIASRRRKTGRGPLHIGSVKPNVGHTEGCSGLAGVFKSIGCLENGMLVPVHGLQTVNPQLSLSDWHLAIPSAIMKWPSGPRRVSVNSFGFGGANAHAILDDAYHFLQSQNIDGHHNTEIHDDSDSDSGVSTGTRSPPPEADRKRLFAFSSKDQAGLQRLAAPWATALAHASLEKHNPQYLTDLSWTLAARRSHLDFRTYAIASSLGELVSELDRGLPQNKRSGRQDRNLIFVCTGQGAQWPGMGRQLLYNNVCHASIKASQQHLARLGCQWDIVQELSKTVDSSINHPEFSQTLCAVLQIALVDLLRHWKILPLASVGHSSGEIAAAHAAGYISHGDAVKIAYIRGLCSASVTRKGAMLAAGLSDVEAQDYLKELPAQAAVVACVNSPSSVTLSGDIDAIEQLERRISGDGKFARKLKVNTAYHSPHMRDVASTYREKMGRIQPILDGESGTAMYSSLTGERIEPQELNEHYWMSNMCAPVEFCKAVKTLLGHKVTVPPRKRETAARWGGIVELGPHAALQGPVQQIIADSNSKSAKDAEYLAMVLRNKDASDTAMQVAARLWCLGHDVDLSAVNEVEEGAKCLTHLPRYPWNHSKSFWHESHGTKAERFPSEARSDLLGVGEALASDAEPRWRNNLRISEAPWIEDHKITGTILYPGAGMLVMALEGALRTSKDAGNVQGFRLHDVSFLRGLVVPSGDESALQTRLQLRPHESIGDAFHFVVSSTTTGFWTTHCTGVVAIEYHGRSSGVEEPAQTGREWTRQVEVFRALERDASAESADIEQFYDHLNKIGMAYGPLFRNVQTLTAVPASRAAYASVAVPDTKTVMPAEYETPHIIHPATLDSVFHLLLAAFNEGRPIQDAAVPFHIDDMFVAASQPKCPGACYSGYGSQVQKSADGHEAAGDLVVSDDAWSEPKLVVKSFALRQVTGASGAEADAVPEEESKCARLSWREDVGFIRSADQVIATAPQGSAGQLAKWLRLLAHKQSISNVLVVLGDVRLTGADVVRDLHRHTGHERGLKYIRYVCTEDCSDEVFQSLFHDQSAPDREEWSPGSEESLVTEVQNCDLIFVLGENIPESLQATLRTSQASRGHVIVGSEKTSAETIHALGRQSKDFISFSHPGNPTYAVELPQPAKAAGATSTEATILMHMDASAAVRALASALTETLASRGVQARSVLFTPEEVSQLRGRSIISLLEAEAPFVYFWSDDSFQSFKTIVSSAAHMLWLTHGGLLQEWSAGVEFAPAQGLLRVLRNEYSSITLPHLDLSGAFDITDPQSARFILDVWDASLALGAEMEYAELHGVVHIPRAVSEHGFDDELQVAAGTAAPVSIPIREASGPLMLTQSTHGDQALWSIVEQPQTPIGPREVEVEVEMVGIRKSSSLESRTREAVGIVRQTGEKVESVQTGQRVVTFGTSLCRTLTRQDEASICPIPPKLSSEDAISLSGDSISAHYALSEIGSLSSGSTILILSAGSPVGLAAVRVAHYVGARIFASVETKEQREILAQSQALDADSIYDSSLPTFLSGIQSDTNDRGVDLILNTDDCAASAHSAALLAEFGRYVDLCNVQGLALPRNRRNTSLIRVDADEVFARKPQLIQRLLRQSFEDIVASAFAGPFLPIALFPAAESRKAFDIAEHSATGRAAIRLGPDDKVSIPRSAPTAEIDATATYVLAGGLGALGLEIANMMVQHGARRLCFLSRSGGEKSIEALAAFRARGVDAQALKCDVSDADSVRTVFEQLRAEGHCIGGVIQAAMVLEDAIFENMTHEQWLRASMPKTHGSRNLLDNLAASESPFFILLSSITGIIGNAAQSNYAAGNTFEDALAAHARTHLSIAATSIDVGLVVDSSHFTNAGEFGDISNYLRKYGHGWQGMQTSLNEVCVAVLALIRGRSSTGSPPAQFVLGLGDRIFREPGAMGFQNDPKFALRTADRVGTSAVAGQQVPISNALQEAASSSEAAEAVEGYLAQQIAVACGIETDEVDTQKPLFDFGVDSLKAVELRNRVGREMQSEVSVFELLGATPVSQLSTMIADRSSLVVGDKT